MWRLFHGTYALSRRANQSPWVSFRQGIKMVVAKLRGRLPDE